MSCAKPIGPGPGAYQLPTTVGHERHDPSRNRQPMYSFGIVGNERVKPLGPGPSYRIERVTRDGPVSSPEWSFGAALPQRKATRAPGPGAHAPERCPLMRERRPPAYSMGARIAFMLKRPGPASNAYALVSKPFGPSYSMGARFTYNLKALSPGPALYFQRDTNVYKNRQPIYSMAAMMKNLRQRTPTPGPAAYPPNLYNVKKRPYSYSFGRKHATHACPMIIKEDTMDCL